MNESVARQIHEKAAPIVAWLRTAEEESSGEEEDDEDEVEVVYSENAGSKGITTIIEKPPQPVEEVRETMKAVHGLGTRLGIYSSGIHVYHTHEQYVKCAIAGTSVWDEFKHVYICLCLEDG